MHFYELEMEYLVFSSDLLAGASAAAKHTGLSERAIYHLVYGGELPVTRKGRRLYFRKSELEAAFSANLERAA